MLSKKIKCPKCGGILEVTNPKDKPSLLIACPKEGCGTKMRINFDTGKTVLADFQPRGDVRYSLRCNGITYPLAIGKNTIGRKSPTSEASIQIETNDLAMSRLHAEITLMELPNGRTKVIFGDLRSAEKAEKRPILIESEPLAAIDRIILSPGDSILLGNTLISFTE